MSFRAIGLAALFGAASLIGCASQKPSSSEPASSAPRGETTPAQESDPPSARECMAFTNKVNETLRKVMDLTQAKSENDEQLIADMNTLGSLYDDLARDIGKLDIQSAALRKHVDEYREMCGKAASSARRVGMAVRTKNVAEAQAAEKDFDQVVVQEDKLVDRINRVCRVSESAGS